MGLWRRFRPSGFASGFPGRPRRESQRGAAAVEMALSTALIVPMLMATLNFGYYFYVAVTATEATRVGARKTASTSISGSCANAAAVTAASTAGTNAALAYMGQIGMGTIANTTVTATCGNVPLVPTWTFTVQVDFPPIVGFLTQGMKPSSHSGWVVAKQSLVLMGR